MSAETTLYELLDLSIGPPHAGTVNFCALHSLLFAILERLKVQELSARSNDEEQSEGAQCALQLTTVPLPRRSTSYGHEIEEKLKHIEEKMVALERLPCGADILGSKSEPTVNELWQIMQLRRKVQANEDGVSQAMGLIQDLLKEIRDLRESRDVLRTEVKGLQELLAQLNVTELLDKSSSVEQCCHQVSDVEKALGELQERLRLYPQPEELTQYVSWEVLQDALVKEREQARQDQQEIAAMVTPIHTETLEAVLKQTNAHSPRALSAASYHHPEPPGSSNGNWAPLQVHSEGVVVPAGLSSAAEHYVETAEALKQVSHLQDAQEMLEARVDHLETIKADWNQVQGLRNLLGQAANSQGLDRLQLEWSHLKEQMDMLTTDREKLQAEFHKLHDAIRHLEKEYSLRQKHIDELYKSLERLDEKKANKDLVESEIKADKSLPETKVSHKQFEEMTERLAAMFEDLHSKVSGQGQDWHMVIQKISADMDSKLDRTELDSVLKQLEDRWKAILKHLQTQPVHVQNGAAGIRKQLVEFHCISCDRPVGMTIPGPHLVTVPLAPSFLPHKPSRPQTIHETEPLHQHVPSDQMPDTVDYGYPPLARSCGGNHTLTHPSRRYTRLQNFTHVSQVEEEELAKAAERAQAEEINILGLDGHVYRGRLNSRSLEIRLPNISKDGSNKHKVAKVGRTLPQRPGTTEASHGLPQRPQSADCLHN